MDELEDMLLKVKKRITPTKREIERLNKTLEEIKEKLTQQLPRGVNIKYAGSVAKGTSLKGDTDIDIFIIFPKSYSFNDMIDTFFYSIRKAFGKYEKAYAQHPYARIKFNKIKIDLVPAYEYNGGKPISAVDRSQAHVEYINKHLNDYGKSEVRLLKQFMKNLNLYGAEIKINGFSGYLCELLIVKYSSFIELIKNASKWKPNIRICLSKTCDFSEFNDPLIVIDPVDPGRNVASPVSLNTLSRFILASKAFLLNPSMDFFFVPKRLNIKLPERYLVITFRSPNVVDDVLFGQLKRMASNLKSYLLSNGFDVFNPLTFNINGYSFITLGILNKRVSQKFIKEGPYPYVDKHIRGFLERNEYVWIENGRLFGVGKRKFSDIPSSLDHFFSSIPLPKYYRDGPIMYGILSNSGLNEAEFLIDNYRFDKCINVIDKLMYELRKKRFIDKLIFLSIEKSLEKR